MIMYNNNNNNNNNNKMRYSLERIQLYISIVIVLIVASVVSGEIGYMAILILAIVIDSIYRTFKRKYNGKRRI